MATGWRARSAARDCAGSLNWEALARRSPWKPKARRRQSGWPWFVGPREALPYQLPAGYTHLEAVRGGWKIVWPPRWVPDSFQSDLICCRLKHLCATPTGPVACSASIWAWSRTLLVTSIGHCSWAIRSRREGSLEAHSSSSPRRQRGGFLFCFVLSNPNITPSLFLPFCRNPGYVAYLLF